MSSSSLQNNNTNTIIIPSHRAIDFGLVDETQDIRLVSRQLRRQKRQATRRFLKQQSSLSAMMMNADDDEDDSVAASSVCPSVDDSTTTSNRSHSPQCRSVDLTGRIVDFDPRLCL